MSICVGASVHVTVSSLTQIFVKFLDKVAQWHKDCIPFFGFVVSKNKGSIILIQFSLVYTVVSFTAVYSFLLLSLLFLPVSADTSVGSGNISCYHFLQEMTH